MAPRPSTSTTTSVRCTTRRPSATASASTPPETRSGRFHPFILDADTSWSMTGRGPHPALDAHAYPVDHLAEVAPGLAIADDTVSPTELSARGDDAIYDVYGPGIHA